MTALRELGRWMAVCVGLWCVPLGSFAAPVALDVEPISGSVALKAHQFEVLLNQPASVGAAEIQNPQLQGAFTVAATGGNDSLALGFQSEAVWLRVRLRNSADLPVTRLLEVQHAALYNMHAHLDAGGSPAQSLRTVPHRYPVFEIALAGHSEVALYLKVESAYSLALPMRLWEPESFFQHARNDYSGQAWYFGMAFAMLAFNLLLFIALRDSVYFYYVVFVACTALTAATGNGLSREFLWPDWPWMAENALALTNSATVVSLMLFVRRMLETRHMQPGLDRVLLGFAGFVVLVCGVTLVVGPAMVPVISVLYALGAPLVVIAGVRAAVAGARSAVILLSALAMLLMGGVASILLGFNVLPANFWTLNGVQIGSAVEMVVLALALADRFNQSRRETLRAQADALAAERKLVETLRTSERVLEERVQERTAELSSAVLRLKRTQAELVQSEKLASLGSLVAGIAHELNTPIGNAVTVSTTMEEAARQLKTDIESAGVRKSSLVQYLDNVLPMTELVVRSCQRAAALVSSFKRVAVDQTSEQRRRFEVKDLVSDICASLRPGYKQLPWVIQEAVPDDLSCDSYPGPLGQVITNIVQNAVIHAFEGRSGGTIRITARQVGSSIELTIADDGKGMSSDVLSRIFDPFFTTRMGQGGSGLGMSIALNIVTGVLGGTLQAHSEPGLGASFIITFPQEPPQGPGPEVLESTYAGFS